MASEHTGLLATDQRESLERDFAAARHADDPNILTCTSTLEMGIDIGDLSSTMLCSIPPSTASYLQRIGRAGRFTGTAFVVSIVNQRPHDLFFYGRPSEMLRGRVDPPGCWLDASAVLVRQYLAFLLDSAVAAQVLTHFPRSGRQLVDDLAIEDGNIPRLLQWATTHEADLQSRFLKRFDGTVLPDTRSRFMDESTTEILNHRIHQAAGEFARMVRDLENARKRLQDQKAKSEDGDAEASNEIDRELRILAGRLRGLSQSTALEIMTDHGLLPNYAFPERGVRFYGSVYNKHHRDEERVKPVELTRPASAALRELAPANHFYTNSRKFDIQQIAIGNANQPLVQTWAICGACGHMRREVEINQPGANPACPQCGHNVGSSAQIDRGQQKRFLEFSQSQAISQMENYDSLSGDSSEERDRQLYQILRSFDLTLEAPAGAVADEELPFGIEYLGGVVMREINVGFQGEQGALAFGVGQEAPDVGFRICGDCGVVVPPGQNIKQVDHRRSCTTRRANDRRRQQKRSELAYPEQSTYLYRSLRSEAIRLLLPLADDEDVATLTACVHLGLRLRFDGNPAHLIVTPHVMPNTNTGTNRYYLILMDSVPGGTGYLKSLYQTVDSQGRAGEGLMSVLRLAKNALETCSCRRVQQDIEAAGASGCYRCIRAYHLQYSADQVSSDRGIELLDRLIRAGEKRKPQAELKSIKPTSLFGSMLERRFIDRLQQFVEASGGQWNETIIRGNRGYQFTISPSNRIWEIELQPRLGMAQGVMIDCQPDFLIRCDDDQQLPIAVFTDGFEYHCWPENRLSDDFHKRGAILESGNYRVWSVTWDDLDPKLAGHVVTTTPEYADIAEKYANLLRNRGQIVPEVRGVVASGFEQLKTFLACPELDGWQSIVSFLAFFPLQQRSYQTFPTARLAKSIEEWAVGNDFDAATTTDSSVGDMQTIFNLGVGPHQDIVSLMSQEDFLGNRHSMVSVLARLSDSDAEVNQRDYRERWRRFLAHVNQYQFIDRFQFFTSTQSKQKAVSVMLSNGNAGVGRSPLGSEWARIVAEVVAVIRPWIEDLALQATEHNIAIPSLEHFNEQIQDDAFAEVAWPESPQRLAILVGDQADFRNQWEDQGWKVVTIKELHDFGIEYLIDCLKA
ncbi:MAG: helicase-related protein [Planctomycetaceae bacterium]